MSKLDLSVSSTETTIIYPRNRLGWPDFSELWSYRELLLVLTMRDIKVRYKRAFIGLAWAFIQPFMTLVVFTLIFGRLAKVPSDDIPYAVFAMAGLLPWQLFSRALTQASSSLVSMQGMMTKTYFPRLIAPLSEVLACLPDFLVSLLLLGGVMMWYGVVPSWGVLLIPALTLLAVLASLSLALWLAALNIEYRDVQFALPFLSQIWMYATPVVYSLSSVPEKWRWLVALNPMTVVIEGFRCCALGKPWIMAPHEILVSVCSVAFFLTIGLRYFDKVQRTFADRV